MSAQELIEDLRIARRAMKRAIHYLKTVEEDDSESPKPEKKAKTAQPRYNFELQGTYVCSESYGTTKRIILKVTNRTINQIKKFARDHNLKTDSTPIVQKGIRISVTGVSDCEPENFSIGGKYYFRTQLRGYNMNDSQGYYLKAIDYDKL
jgi:hypothetical protein